MTTSISRTAGPKYRIPRRFHARLFWLGFLDQKGWASVDQTWKDLWELQQELTPYLEETESGEEEEGESERRESNKS